MDGPTPDLPSVPEHERGQVGAAAEQVTRTMLRLGWTLAEVRGRLWPDGPRPVSSPLPPWPADALPLRSQRSAQDAQAASVAALATLARQAALETAPDLEIGVRDWATESSEGERWAATASSIREWDRSVQDELARRDDHHANAYLLGRGLAECYWGHGAPSTWTHEGADTAVSPLFLLGEDRRRELTRMLGRLDPEARDPLTAAALSGSLEAWGAVVADPTWVRSNELPTALYEQVRRWYQLLVFDQDPSTLIRPYARLARRRDLGRLLRAFWPQLLLVLVALGLVAAFLGVVGDSAPGWASSLLATGGLGAFVVAGVLARGQSAAQRLVTRLRQDAYTDLIAIDVSVVPPYPGGDERNTLRRARRLVESAVGRRSLTTATPPPDPGR